MTELREFPVRMCIRNIAALITSTNKGDMSSSAVGADGSHSVLIHATILPRTRPRRITSATLSSPVHNATRKVYAYRNSTPLTCRKTYRIRAFFRGLEFLRRDQSTRSDIAPTKAIDGVQRCSYPSSKLQPTFADWHLTHPTPPNGVK